MRDQGESGGFAQIPKNAMTGNGGEGKHASKQNLPSGSRVLMDKAKGDTRWRKDRQEDNVRIHRKRAMAEARTAPRKRKKRNGVSDQNGESATDRKKDIFPPK